METSPRPGTSSSPQRALQSRERVIAACKDLEDRSPLKEILSAFSSAYIASILKNKKEPAVHIVGGALRDLFCGQESVDLDLTTSLLPAEILRLSEAASIRVIPTGLKHQTVTLLVNDVTCEVTTFRAGRGAQSESLTIEDDLAGRDFTINAIAFSCVSKELIDPFGGIEDLSTNTLRCVGSADERIKEDPLRILRAIRFGPAEGRSIDTSLSDAIEKYASLLKKVSVERIRVEIEKILLAPFPADGFRALNHHGLLQYTVPELSVTVGFEQNKFHIHDVFEHTMDVLSKCPRDLILRLAAVYHDIGKAHTLSVDEKGERHFYDHERVSYEICLKGMETLKFSNKQIQEVSKVVLYHMRPFDCGPSGVRRLRRDLGELFPLWREFKNADHPAVYDWDKLDELKTRFDAMVQAEIEREKDKGNKLNINGDELSTLGIPKGPSMGKIIRHLEQLVLEDPEKNTNEFLRDYVVKSLLHTSL